ncbi:hypothetical protein QAD02_010850 [Eretmocerus hayati]|uniref:Uncharacterized protein n=1 Tax=Eretmocerus hayati TaxID=131215 RepID=A0ACC2NXP4_9HYME|nr:hypothetical protein QAD02_010850 [Eretmocerus hayati]
MVNQSAYEDKFDELEISPLKQTHGSSRKRVKRQDEEINLNVLPAQQEDPFYCVIACCESVLRYMGLTLEQVRPPFLPSTATYQDSVAYRILPDVPTGGASDLLRDFDSVRRILRDRSYGTNPSFVNRLNALISVNNLNARRQYTATQLYSSRYYSNEDRAELYDRMQMIVRASLENNMPVILLRLHRVRNYGALVYPERWEGHATLIHSIGPQNLHPMFRHYGIMDPWTGTFRDMTAWEIAVEGGFWLVHYDDYRERQHIPEPMQVDEPNYLGLAVLDNLDQTDRRSLCMLDTLGTFASRSKREVNWHHPGCSDTTKSFKINVIQEYDVEPPPDRWFKKGALFIGTDHGVYLINGDQVNEKRPEIGRFNLNTEIRDIVIDYNGNAFVINYDGDMYRLDIDNKWGYVKYDLQGAKVNVVKVLKHDDGKFKKGTAYIGTNKGVYFKYGDGLNQEFTDKFQLTDDIRDFTWDNRGSAFAISHSGDMYHLDLEGWGYVKYDLGGAKVNVVKVLGSDDGKFKKGTAYIGTNKGVYFKYGDGLNQEFTDKFQLTDRIRDFTWDNRGSAFALSHSGDMYHLDLEGWGYVKYDLGGAKVNVVKVLSSDDGEFKKGTAYIGTNKGVYFKYGDGLNQEFTDKFQLTDDIRDFTWDNEGSAFATSHSGDKFHLNLKGWGYVKVMSPVQK